jgi:nitric oxide reductase subunit C
MLSKSQARAFFFGGTGVFTLAFLALTVDSMRQLPAQTRAHNITDSVRRGKHLWESNNCMGCHTLFGEGAYYAPELTKSVERRGKDWLRVFLKDPQAMFPGQRRMVRYNFTAEQIEDVIAFLDWCGEVDLNGFPAKPPLGRQLQATTPTAPSSLLPKPVPAIFTTAACIGCHSIAGEGGAAGALIGAPALDEVHKRRTREETAAWIRDPQKSKPDTKMPDLVPSVVSEAQLTEIVNYLYSPAPSKP